jgi:superoxide dismutase, Fe-Mn family
LPQSFLCEKIGAISYFEKMKFVLPPLPFAKNALEPHMSAQTLALHHDKHHAAYVAKTNALIENSEFENLSSLEKVFLAAYGKNDAVFNNAAQAWNHEFFWNLMAPGSQTPSGKMQNLIEKNFDSWENFVAEFVKIGSAQFGSGWVWLTEKNGTLEILKTENAKNPIVLGKKPLIGCDVWEHSYYLDFQSRRPDYLKNFVENLVNWDFVEQQLSR